MIFLVSFLRGAKSKKKREVVRVLGDLQPEAPISFLCVSFGISSLIPRVVTHVIIMVLPYLIE